MRLVIELVILVILVISNWLYYTTQNDRGPLYLNSS